MSPDGVNWNLKWKCRSADSAGWMTADFPASDAQRVRFELSKTRAKEEDGDSWMWTDLWFIEVLRRMLY